MYIIRLRAGVRLFRWIKPPPPQLYLSDRNISIELIVSTNYFYRLIETGGKHVN